MGWIHRTMILSAAIVEQARALAEALEPNAAANMWTTPCYNAEGEVTHYVSAGMIEEPFGTILGSPEALSAACGVTLEQATGLLSMADITDEDPYTALSRLELSLTPPAVEE